MSRILTGLCLLTSLSVAQAFDVSDYRLIDLTHTYDDSTIYWPTSPTSFELETLAEGETPGGWYYSAKALCTPEHGGTHLDAPIHFDADGVTADALPLTSLIAPAVVIDVSARAEADPAYRLSRQDVLDFEKVNGRIAKGAIVLLNTGWSKRWPDRLRYMGDDTPGDASKLVFPSYGAEAADLLVTDREVAVLGVDTASIDYGPSDDFIVHRIAAAENVAGLENLTNLGDLPATGAIVIALPMKIGGGSGGPVRVVALVAR
jgi:kynurenine formamidase